MSITIARTIELPEWNADAQKAAVDFWTNHEMSMTQNEHSLTGRRGGNFTVLISNKPTAIASQISITSFEPTRIDCVMKASTKFQMWSVWDTTIFELELTLFDHFVKTGDPSEALWQDFMTTYAKHYWMVNISGGLVGLHMSKSEKLLFRSLIELHNERAPLIAMKSPGSH